MNLQDIDQILLETIHQQELELQKLKHLTTQKTFSVEQKKQQKRNWENLKVQQKKTNQRSQEENNRTRKKILIGNLYLSRMEKDPEKYAPVLSILEKTLIRDHDRKLFGFPVLSKEDKATRK